jgi:antitoxin component YwqK of YwqJK toxin-antitoxin module
MKIGDIYSNGQRVTVQDGDILTYFFEDGSIKAQGKYANGAMQGEWLFNKKEGYRWQVGHFDEAGQKHGSWVRYLPDGSVQVEQHFDHGKQVVMPR